MKQIKFKGVVITTRKTVNNILRVFDQCNDEDKKEWYQEAHEYANSLSCISESSKYKVSLVQACGIIAALSPLKSWDENKVISRSFIMEGIGKHTQVMTNKAKAIVNLDQNDPEIEERIVEILNGNKISAFFLNILKPTQSNVLTIDRHAICIALGRIASENEMHLTTNQYRFFEMCFTIAGVKRDVPPILMQSATWCAWRRIKNR